jgi:hypothetical protein
MPVLLAVDIQFHGLFPRVDHRQERARWFIVTLQAILQPITASRTQTLPRNIATMFARMLGDAKYVTFMVSLKPLWPRVWAVLLIIEAEFREIKQEIGRARTQQPNPGAVTNNRYFRMVATTTTRLYAAGLDPARTRASLGHRARQRTCHCCALAHDLADIGFGVDCGKPDRGTRNPLIAAVMGLAA